MLTVQHIVSALVAAASIAAALPTYKIPIAFPKILLEDASCVLPQNFTVSGLQVWSPAANNSQALTINFQYANNMTDINTGCHLNGTSKNVGASGLAPRYACDNTIVEFIWQNNTLTLIEKACPWNSSPQGFEASGSLHPALSCTATSLGSPQGNGSNCTSVPDQLQANFTSLQPTPN